MILGRCQSTVGMKECRIRGMCYECGAEGFPSCSEHMELLKIRRNKKYVDGQRKASDGICSECGFDFRKVERAMKIAGDIAIRKFLRKQIAALLGTGLPIDINAITSIGKRVALCDYSLEDYARHDKISTVNEKGDMICVKCL